MHLYNSEREGKKESEKAHLEQLKAERRRPKPLTAEQRDQVLAHKRQQLNRWLADDGPVARERADALRAEVADLEAEAMNIAIA